MRRIITGASGFIGRHLVERWSDQHEIIAIGRSTQKINHLFGNKVTAISWEQLAAQGHQILAGAQVVVNLAGTNIGKGLWSEKRKESILQSRTQCTALIAEICASLGAQSPALLNASAIGVYGLEKTTDHKFDESTNIDFTQKPDFLATVARAWELAALPAKNNGVRVVWMRFGVVLAKDGGVLPQLSLPVKLFAGGTIGTGLQAFSWISLDDLIAAIEFLIDHPEISGVVNLTAPQCLQQKELVKNLGKVLHRPVFFKIPAFILKLILGQMAEELLLSGQCVYPQRLLQAGFQFQYPDIESALKHIYGKNT